MLLHGEGVKANAPAGVRWTRRAAEAGEPRAMHRMGRCYRGGQGVAVDLEVAKQWFARAARAGDRDSMVALSRMNEGEERERWLRKAATSGHHGAMFLLGQQLLDGGQTDAERTEGAAFIRAAAEGNRQAAQFAAANQDTLLAAEANAGRVRGTRLRILYKRGRRFETGNDGAPVDIEQAVACYTEAADGGHTRAQRRLGGILLRGDTGVRRVRLARYYLHLSAWGGDRRALSVLASHYTQTNLNAVAAAAVTIILTEHPTIPGGLERYERFAGTLRGRGATLPATAAEGWEVLNRRLEMLARNVNKTIPW
jgi:TPR repeat protein